MFKLHKGEDVGELSIKRKKLRVLFWSNTIDHCEGAGLVFLSLSEMGDIGGF